MKSKHRCHFGILGAFVFTANLVHGAEITQTANDTSSPANSFTESARWSNSAVPSAGNTYSNNGFLFRTPNTNPASVTFAGDSLTVTAKSAASGVGAAVITKGTGNQTVSFNNLIMSGGIVSQGTQGVTHTITGTITSNATSGFSITDSSDRNFAISAPVSGSGRLFVGSFNSYNAAGYTPVPYTNTFTVSGNNSSFSGGWSLGGSYLATFFGGATTYNNIFNASGTTFRVGHANALGTGTFELKEGTLNLNGFSPTGLSGLTVPNSSAPTLRTAGNTISASAVSLGTTSGATLKIDNGGAANPTSAPIQSTTLTVNGPSTLSLIGTGLSAGTFPIISYSGSIAGPNGFSDLSLTLPPGVSGSLVDNPGVSVDATITGVEFIQWTGAASGAWNTADINWKTATGLVDTAYTQNSSGGHSVLFNESESAASPVAVSIPTAVSPNAITINNPTKNYTFSGQAISGTAAIVKDGAGTATFSNTLSCTGGTTINGGKIALAGAAPSAATLVPTSVASGATLEYTSASNFNQGGIALTGAGTLLKSGAGTMTFNAANSTIALAAGGLIDVQAGRIQFGNFDAAACSAASNQSDLNIASGATFDGHAGTVAVDKLTGSGTYQAGYFGPRSLSIGVNGGSSTFSGTIKGNGIDGNSQTQLVKRGNGTITLTGTVTARGAFGGSSVEVRGGTIASPSTLVLSPTDPLSTTGYTGGRVYIGATSTDVAVLTQTAGTLLASTMSVGENAQATYNISGGTLNTGSLELAFTGGAPNGPVVMNVSDTAQVNVNSNGNILMGQFFGRSVTVNQSGGTVAQFSDVATTRGGTGRMNFNSGNQNVTWNLGGGTLSLAGIARNSGSGFGGGNGIINLNGGTLQITNSSFSVPTGTANAKPVIALNVLGDDLTPDSGAIIDNYGLAVTIAAGLLHSGPSFFDGGLKVSSSVSGGSLTLSGINTYTGNTTVVSGSTLSLADNAQLKFIVDGSTNTKLTGAGTANLDGDFNIDTTYADLTSGNTWTLVDVATRNYGGTFTVVGFTGASGIWTKTDGANVWSFDQSTGVLTLTVVPGYASWIGGFSVSDAGTAADPDYDGTSNLLEYVLNGDPSASDPAILPTLDSSGANFMFHFTRREESATDTTQVFQYGSDLVGWTPINITPPVGSEVTLGTPSGGTQEVTVTIPKSVAVGGKLFGRLKASQP
jgi:autotransporter-associated beta strand protein